MSKNDTNVQFPIIDHRVRRITQIAHSDYLLTIGSADRVVYHQHPEAVPTAHQTSPRSLRYSR